MKKVGVLVVVVIMVVSSLIIGNSMNPAIIKADTQDRYPPQISAASPNPQTVGFGYNVTISPTVTDNLSGVQLVKVNITYPDCTHNNFTVAKKQGTTYEYNFSDTWQHGRYNYTIWATDNASNINSSSHHSFNITAYATIHVATLKDNYTDNECINLTDPPNPPQNLTVVGRGLTWNNYYSTSTGDNILETYQGPVNYQEDNGSWTPIDRTLQTLQSSHPAYAYGYRTGNEHGLFGVYFKPNAQNNWPVAFAYNHSHDPTVNVIRSKLVGVGYVDPLSNWSYTYLQNVQNSQGQMTGSTITYPGVFTGTDVSWQYSNTELKEAITLSNVSKTVLQNHPPSQYGLHDASSYLVFITKLDHQNLNLYNVSGMLTGNVTISDIGVDFKDVAGFFKCALPLGDAYELNNDSVRQKLTYRIVHLNGNTYLLSGLKVSDLISMSFPVVIDPTLSVNSLTNDGFISSSSTTYSTVWGASSGTVDSTSVFLSMGQKKVASFPPTYYIYRSFLLFNTSSLPSNACIVNATLSLYKKDDYSTTDFTITIQNGQPTYPHNPLQAGDYAKGHYAGNGGGLNTSKFVNGRNVFGLTNLSWINRTSVTKLCLRSSRDINGAAPTGNEYVNVYSANALDPNPNVSYKPKLIISYRNQSKIKNTGTTDIKGYLVMQVQYYWNAFSWVIENETIIESSPRIIKVGEYLGLDSIFNGQVNASNLTYGNGTYRVYIALCSPQNQVLVSSDSISLEATYAFVVTQSHPLRWQRLAGSGFNSGNNIATRGMTVYNNELYVGTENFNKEKLRDLFLCNGFPAGTKICMADETMKNIEELTEGDIVKALDIGNDRFVNAYITKIYQHTSDETPDHLIKINGNFQVSPKQVLYVNDTFMTAEEVKVGEYLTDINGSIVNITSVANASMRLALYSFVINADPMEIISPNNLTFFANNVQAFSWSEEGVDDYCGELEALGIGPILSGLITLGNEFLLWVRSYACDGFEIWKYNTVSGWSRIIGYGLCGDYENGFGDSSNWAAGDMIEFQEKLYVGTWQSPYKGCEIWCFDGSQWNPVVGRDATGNNAEAGFGDAHNMAITSMEVFQNKLYVGTMNFNWGPNGFCQVWRTGDGINWEKVVDRGFRDEGAGSGVRNAYAWRMENDNNQLLYVGTFNIPIPIGIEAFRGCQLWKSDTGNLNDWDIVPLPNGNGFGERQNYGVRGLVKYGSSLYIGTATSFLQPDQGSETEALEIWRLTGSTLNCLVGENSIYQPKIDDGFWNYYNKYIWSMTQCGNKLWAGTANVQILPDNGILSYGCEVWCYDTQTGWTSVVKTGTGNEISNGFGNSYNLGARSMCEYPTDHLIVGTFVHSNDPLKTGCEVWMRNPYP
jgi:hypothetical protein